MVQVVGQKCMQCFVFDEFSHCGDKKKLENFGTLCFFSENSQKFQEQKI
jgi:hypothetical protein